VTETRDPFEAIAQALEVDELQALHVTARGDPLAGGARYVDSEPVEAGAWHDLADPVTGLPPECPVTPLGKADELYYFLDTLGGVAMLKASASGKGPIGSLFAGRSRYLEWAWPRFTKGKTRAVVGWEADDARQALMDACAFVGVFDDVDRVRGRGAWQDSFGGLIYHAGDRVWIGGRWKTPGIQGPWVFPARPAILTPWPKPVEGGEGGPAAQVLALLETWNWRRREIDARLLLGWICAAMIGGALDWRPMIFLTGDQGTGKSTLQKLVKLLFGNGLIASTNTTGPGIYQKLKHDCIPVGVDELEVEADTRKVDEVIKIVRQAASGGRLMRGTSEGASREYECRSAFLLSAINVPPLQGQDQSRLAILALGKLEKAAVDPVIDAAGLPDLGRQILRRMVDGWPRWAPTLRAFREALIAGGHDGRTADQFGPMLAGAHIAMSDAPPDRGVLEQWAAWLDPRTLAETSGQTPNWRQCLGHLTDVQPDAFRTYARKSLGAYVADYRDLGHAALTDLEDRCRDVGLAISFEKGAALTWDNARLFVPSSHPEVSRLFGGTQWAGRPGAAGVWGSALRQAPEDVCWTGVCGKGLDRERKGVFIRLSAVFGAPQPLGREDVGD
jgi:hypothetical protein